MSHSWKSSRRGRALSPTATATPLKREAHFYAPHKKRAVSICGGQCPSGRTLSFRLSRRRSGEKHKRQGGRNRNMVRSLHRQTGRTDPVMEVAELVGRRHCIAVEFRVRARIGTKEIAGRGRKLQRCHLVQFKDMRDAEQKIPVAVMIDLLVDRQGRRKQRIEAERMAKSSWASFRLAASSFMEAKL